MTNVRVTKQWVVLHDPVTGEAHDVWVVMITWFDGGPKGDYEMLTDCPNNDEVKAVSLRLRNKHGLVVA